MKCVPHLLTIMAIWLTATSSAFADGDSAAKDSTAKKLFKEAFFQQTVEGNIARAIEIYQEGLKKPDVPAKLAATAYYQLGTCYEKQNDKAKAIECYEKLVDQYPGETKNAAKAKKKLSVLVVSDRKKRSDIIAYVENLPVDRLDIHDKQVTRQYIKEKFGPPQFEHGRGLFINYGGKYGLRFDMKGDRVHEICLFKTFPGEIQVVNAQGELSTHPPLTKDLVSPKIELRKAQEKQYTVYLENLPVDRLDIHDKKVTRQYIKEKFGPPQFEHPQGLFLNYGEKYGLRFDMDGDRVREICLFKTFPGVVYSGFQGAPGMVHAGASEENPKRISPLKDDLKGRRIFLVAGKAPIDATIIDEAGKPIADVKIQYSYVPKVQPANTSQFTISGYCGVGTSSDGRFSLPNIKGQILMFLECQHEHYATKMVPFPNPDNPKYEKMMSGELPVDDGVYFKEGKLNVVMNKGASLRGTANFILDGGRSIPAAGYQIGLASKGFRGGTKATVQNHNGEFFFDGIMEMEPTGVPNKMKPAVWELSCKREDAPNSEWATKELTFEKGEQAVVEITIKYDPTTAKPIITITKLPPKKMDDKK